jgi:hypothetical protein
MEEDDDDNEEEDHDRNSALNKDAGTATVATAVTELAAVEAALEKDLEMEVTISMAAEQLQPVASPPDATAFSLLLSPSPPPTPLQSSMVHNTKKRSRALRDGAPMVIPPTPTTQLTSTEANAGGRTGPGPFRSSPAKPPPTKKVKFREVASVYHVSTEFIEPVEIEFAPLRASSEIDTMPPDDGRQPDAEGYVVDGADPVLVRELPEHALADYLDENHSNDNDYHSPLLSPDELASAPVSTAPPSAFAFASAVHSPTRHDVNESIDIINSSADALPALLALQPSSPPPAPRLDVAVMTAEDDGALADQPVPQPSSCVPAVAVVQADRSFELAQPLPAYDTAHRRNHLSDATAAAASLLAPVASIAVAHSQQQQAVDADHDKRDLVLRAGIVGSTIDAGVPFASASSSPPGGVEVAVPCTDADATENVTRPQLLPKLRAAAAKPCIVSLSSDNLNLDLNLNLNPNLVIAPAGEKSLDDETRDSPERRRRRVLAYHIHPPSAADITAGLHAVGKPVLQYTEPFFGDAEDAQLRSKEFAGMRFSIPTHSVDTLRAFRGEYSSAPGPAVTYASETLLPDGLVAAADAHGAPSHLRLTSNSSGSSKPLVGKWRVLTPARAPPRATQVTVCKKHAEEDVTRVITSPQQPPLLDEEVEIHESLTLPRSLAAASATMDAARMDLDFNGPQVSQSSLPSNSNRNHNRSQELKSQIEAPTPDTPHGYLFSQEFQESVVTDVSDNQGLTIMGMELHGACLGFGKTVIMKWARLIFQCMPPPPPP